MLLWVRKGESLSHVQLCNPMDCSLPLSVEFHSKNTGVGGHSLL